MQRFIHQETRIFQFDFLAKNGAQKNQAFQPALQFMGMLILALAISGCGPSEEAAPQAPLSMRTPRATFTPTAATVNNAAASSSQSNDAVAKEPVVQVADDTTGASSDSTATGGAVTAENAAKPAEISSERVEIEDGGTAVVGIQLLNGRSGPGAEFDLVGIVGKGEFFDIIGRNDAGDWWEVCCYLDTPFWMADEFVDIRGGNTNQVASAPPTAVPAVAIPATPIPPTAIPPTAVPPAPIPPTAVPVTSAASQPAATATPQPVVAPAETNFDFELKASEQFPETNVPRIFLYVFKDGQALPGFSLKVTKDGADVTVSETSFGPQGGFTWPVESARQRFQNMKVEFPDQSPGGTWIVQLADGGGNPVGPPVTFTLGADDENQEMYVRYEQR